MKHGKGKDSFKPFRIIKNTVLLLLIVVLTLVLCLSIYSRLSGKAPSLFGYSLFRVSSGSMQPTLDVGDVILVQQCDGKSVENGDVVTYVATTGEMQGKLVTHRVIKSPYMDNGEVYVVTKGDANLNDDPPVSASQIEGKLVIKIGILKYLFDFFITPWGLLTIIALIFLAFFNEILLFVRSAFGIGYKPKYQASVDDIIERVKEEADINLGNSSDESDDEG